MSAHGERPVLRLGLAAQSCSEKVDTVAVEEPLEIRVNGRSVAVVMRTPGDDRALALGFLVSEGVVARASQVEHVEVFPHDGAAGNVAAVRLAAGLEPDFERLTRHVFGASSCGVCGTATIEAVLRRCAPLAPRTDFPAGLLRGLPERLRAEQPSFASTGGVHGAAIFDARGSLLAVREDVGRHNAVDKLIGWALEVRPLPLTACGLLLSGRISFELVQKALAAGIEVVAGLGAPSTLAVDCADAGGVTLVGFLRAERMNIYTHAVRIAA